MVEIESNVDGLLKARAEIDEELRRHKLPLTVLFTDVVGSTSYFDRFGDTAGLAMIHRYGELASSVAQELGGRVIKTIGDSVMAEFPDPSSAVHAAVEIQRRLLELNLTVPEPRRVELRIGIHSGVGFRRGTDVYGDVVNLAARITKRSGPAQILVSRLVHEAIAGNPTLSSNWLSKLTIDGRAEKEDIYEIVWTDAAAYQEIRQRVTAQNELAAPGAKMATGLPFSSRYKILAVVGTGGMGIVYKACDLETNEIVALKALKPEIASDPLVQEQFKNELCLARKITHKNVCRIYDFNRSNGMAYTSMEFVEGESLLAVLNRFGGLPLRKAIDIARQICAGLREAHLQGIVHRDLKPANIMLDRNGNVKIMDFGIARLMPRTGNVTGTIVGTPAYMAPEQAEGKPTDARTDIYAAGLLIYEMITGRPAFDGDTPMVVALKQVRELPTPPRQLEPSLPGYVESAILKCLEKDPAKRYQSVDELDLALQGGLATARARPLRFEIPKLDPKHRELVRNFAGRVVSEAQLQLSSFSEAVAAHWPVVVKWIRLNSLKRVPHGMPIACGAALFAGALLVFLASGAWRHPAIPAPPVQAYAPVIIEKVVLPEPPKQQANPADSGVAKIGVEEPAPADELVADADPGATEKSALTNRFKTPARRVTKGTATPKTSVATQTAVHEPSSPPLAQILNSAIRPMPTSADLPSKIVAPESTTAAQPQPAAPSNLYLQVGAFKEEPWAKNTVDRLVEKGFPAVLVHRGVLWNRSYRVLVGPYADGTQAEAVQKRLEEQGFPKARQIHQP